MNVIEVVIQCHLFYYKISCGSVCMGHKYPSMHTLVKQYTAIRET